MEESFKIYTLKDPENEEVKYVGMTQRTAEKRLERHLNQRYPCKKNDWLKDLRERGLKPEFEVIIDGLKRDEAMALEQQYILMFKSIGAKLTNMTAGGGGIKGFRHSEETKKIISQTSEERGIPRSTINKASEAKLTPVNQYDLRGNYIKTFPSLKDAAKEVGGFYSNISHACNNKIKSSMGFKWKYAN